MLENHNAQNAIEPTCTPIWAQHIKAKNEAAATVIQRAFRRR